MSRRMTTTCTTRPSTWGSQRKKSRTISVREDCDRSCSDATRLRRCGATGLGFSRRADRATQCRCASLSSSRRPSIPCILSQEPVQSLWPEQRGICGRKGISACARYPQWTRPSAARETYPAVSEHRDRVVAHSLTTHSFNTRTLPALPIINNVRFEASLGGWQGVGCYPYALLISIYAHSAVYEPSLRRHQREFWSVLLHVLDNEYRQPRLQTIQLELFNLAGRPIINPGGNHLGICRVSEPPSSRLADYVGRWRRSAARTAP